MRKEYIKKLKTYKELLIECKKIQIFNQLASELEEKISYRGKPKQKILTLNRQNKKLMKKEKPNFYKQVSLFIIFCSKVTHST